jgi:hypothetical protein
MIYLGCARGFRVGQLFFGEKRSGALFLDEEKKHVIRALNTAG